ncbi:hypothetical protein J437_LFUL017732 [Ladona fulva]|uniref:Small ribosomal subunit protein mS33 n=1 Tax=Ladona fulva TaxID=123851 RepID=A0A8K0PBG2_LADFU|nr:hypothetical protein J437_LFUL017732 [Ladona fulva]
MNSLTNRYLALTTAATDYARRMGRLRNRIFGEVVRPETRRTAKVVNMLSVKPVHLRPEIVQYYPRHIETHLLMKKLRFYGLFR